ncbi:MAG: SMC-Scp complex subunit ScpB [Bacillota bacterium]|nr:SMC-Scp complex subunit ScpB [Bacillota bacterium]
MDDIKSEQLEIPEASNRDIYFSIIESLLFVSGEPLKSKDIASILECNIMFVEKLINDLSKKYEAQDRGIKIINVNNEYQLVTKKENNNYIQKLLKVNVRQSLSQASLETLAIIAYKQPVTRAQIDEIRGVKSDSAVSKLLEKDLIKESGRMEMPGRPILYSTTDEFLKQFGFEKVSDIPALEDVINQYKDVEDKN